MFVLLHEYTYTCIEYTYTHLASSLGDTSIRNVTDDAVTKTFG